MSYRGCKVCIVLLLKEKVRTFLNQRVLRIGRFTMIVYCILFGDNMLLLQYTYFGEIEVLVT